VNNLMLHVHSIITSTAGQDKLGADGC
jgi:hypothetical protein